MKKSILFSTIITLLSSSVVLAEDPVAGTSPTDIEIYTKDFGISVKKQSEVTVELPSEELVELNIDELMHSDMGMKPYIGHMHFETTATNCEATITTSNGFVLKGNNSGATLATYKIDYAPGERTVDYSNTDGTQSDPSIMPMPIEGSVTFGPGLPPIQNVACEMADLFMDVATMNSDAPTDFYGDVIHVEVRAES